MSIHRSTSEDSFLRLQVNPHISKSPTINNFQDIQDQEEFKDVFDSFTPNASTVNKDALESFLNIFKQST